MPDTWCKPIPDSSFFLHRSSSEPPSPQTVSPCSVAPVAAEHELVVATSATVLMQLRAVRRSTESHRKREWKTIPIGLQVPPKVLGALVHEWKIHMGSIMLHEEFGISTQHLHVRLIP